MSSLSLPPPFILPLLLVALSPLFSPASGTNYRAGGCDGSTDRAKLYVQGFVPASGEVFTSETVVPATTVACQEINGNASILSDYELVIEWSDTMCDASEATWQLIQVVLEDKNGTQPDPRIMFLGGGCSPSTEPLAALSGRFYNVTQVSYGASTPTLSNRLMFPKFFRTIPSELQANSARFALMDRFDWERVATLHETRSIFSGTTEHFRDRYHRIYSVNGGSDAADEEEDDNLVVRSFTDDPEIPLTQIRDKDIRIILAYMYEDKARYTVCQAIQLNLTTENHLWIFPAWFTHNWWNETVSINGGDTTCSPQQMREAVIYSLFLDSYNETLDNKISDSGLSKKGFLDAYQVALEEFRLSDLYGDSDGPHHYATFAYDAVWTMALALDRTEADLLDYGLSLLNFSYSNEHRITDNITSHMSSPFNGISGRIEFDENGTRKGQNGIYQLVDKNGGEELELVLLYVHNPDDPKLPQNFSLWLREPRWKGNSGPPSDRRQPDTKYLNPGLIIACDVFISLAIVVALGLLVFNLATIWKPLIRDSAPFINTIIICGCVLMLVTCYLLGVDTQTPELSGDDPRSADQENVETNPDINSRRDDRYAVICNLRLWFFTLGFSLSFGALFAKTWQVYRVYTNPKLKKQPFKMWNFLIILAVFLVIDVVYLIIWTSWFSFRRELREMENDKQDTLEVYEKCECDNFNYLIGALYVYKGLLVVFGLFLAYESRNVKYYFINDSRFTSIAVYIVVIVVGIGAPLSLVLSEHLFIDPAYALTVLMVIMATLSCLLILFIPKFIYMAKGRDTMVNENTREEVTAGDGLQLGHTSVDQTEMQTAEEEVRTLQERVEQKTSELHTLEDSLDSPSPNPTTKTRNGSDGDSGVLVTTTDEQPEVFVSEGVETAGTEERRPSSTTTSSASPHGETADEGL